MSKSKKKEWTVEDEMSELLSSEPPPDPPIQEPEPPRSVEVVSNPSEGFAWLLRLQNGDLWWTNNNIESSVPGLVDRIESYCDWAQWEKALEDADTGRRICMNYLTIRGLKFRTQLPKEET